MYQFNKVKLDNGAWRFELDGISLIMDGFLIKGDKHWINNSEKAIALFNFKGEMYSVSNQLQDYKTAEDFYNAMKEQYAFFHTQNKVNNLKYAS